MPNMIRDCSRADSRATQRCLVLQSRHFITPARVPHEARHRRYSHPNRARIPCTVEMAGTMDEFPSATDEADKVLVF